MFWDFSKGLLARWQTYALLNQFRAQILKIYVILKNECICSYELYLAMKSM